MFRLRRSVLIAALTGSLGALPGHAIAATAHNSEAGGWGSTTNNCAPVPGFPADDEGCLSGAIKDDLYGPRGPVYKRDRYRDVPPPPGWPQ